jgi:hypothetical protein
MGQTLVGLYSIHYTGSRNTIYKALDGGFLWFCRIITLGVVGGGNKMKKRVLCLWVSLFLLVPLAVSADSVPTLRTSAQAIYEGFVGTWNTNWGPMVLNVHDGNQINGNYQFRDGQILGEVSSDGKTFIGVWREKPTYQPPNDAGRLRFMLSPDGTRFDGSWGFGDRDDQSPWTATKQGN